MLSFVGFAAKRILSDVPELIEQTVFDGDGETGAQFESRCAKLALERKWGGFKSYGKLDISLNPKDRTEFVQ